MDPTSGIALLEKALRELIGPAFEDEMRAHVEKESWFSPSIPASDILQYRVMDLVERGGDSLWVFDSLRASERKFLAAKVGVTLSGTERISQPELANRIVAALGLPSPRVSGVSHIRSGWFEIETLIKQGEDEKAAVLGRQRAERLLRTLAHFYSNCGRGEAFRAVLLAPGEIRLPLRLKQLLTLAPEQQREALSRSFAEDDWTDLGFLTLYLRRVSALLEKEGAKAVSGDLLVLLRLDDQKAFEMLGQALQAYAHDKPSRLETRRDEFLSAALAVRDSVSGMVGRGVVPDEVLVIEQCRSLLGPVFRGMLEDGRQLRLRADVTPPAGSRVLFVPAARRDHARCDWVPSPWPVE